MGGTIHRFASPLLAFGVVLLALGYLSVSAFTTGLPAVAVLAMVGLALVRLYLGDRGAWWTAVPGGVLLAVA